MQKPVATKIGRRLSDVVAERESRDPEYARSKDDTAPALAIANAVTLARVQSSMTQAQLATLMGTTNTAVSRLESGRHVPNLETVQKLSNALGVAFDFRVRPDRQVQADVSLAVKISAEEPAQERVLVIVAPGSDKGTWIVRRGTAVIATEPTQTRAIDYARRALQRRGGLLATHRSTGEVREVREVRAVEEMQAQTG